MSQTDEQTDLVPQEKRTIDFYGDEIVAFLVQHGSEPRIYVPVRPLCGYMGLTWGSQYNRIKRDEILAGCVFMMKTQVPGDSQVREHVCLPLDVLPGWLFGITTSRVKPDLQAKIRRYREECFRVLWETFAPRMVEHRTAIERFTPATESEQSLFELQRIAEMGRAIASLAEQQIELQRQQDALVGRVDRAAHVVRGIQGDVADIQVRLGSLEETLHPAAYITDEQATEVSNQVKALAKLLTGSEQGKNHYQGIFGELYRRFGVSSYKLIRQEQFAAVLAFLADWHDAASS